MATNTIPQTNQELIARWHKRLREIQFSQYDAAKRFRNRTYWLGIPILVINIVVGSAIFTSFKGDLGVDGKLLAGFTSLATALLVGFQTFLKFNERSEKHNATAISAASLRRKTEQLLAKGSVHTITDAEITKIREEYDRLTHSAPRVPDDIWEKNEKILANQ
ncbi:MAG: hypothetical protein JWR12_3010 [Mucilaginibacter sp.]|nr:hypothetical protein [Mucilaginibacter sp.]